MTKIYLQTYNNYLLRRNKLFNYLILLLVNQYNKDILQIVLLNLIIIKPIN